MEPVHLYPHRGLKSQAVIIREPLFKLLLNSKKIKFKSSWPTWDGAINRALTVASLENDQTHGFPALGLRENMLYDVLDQNSGQGNILVNAYAVEISCGLVPFESFHPNKDRNGNTVTNLPVIGEQ